MAKREDRTEFLLYVALAFAVGFGVAYFVQAYEPFIGAGSMGGHMTGMSGPYSYGMMAFMQGYREFLSADCSTITAQDLEKIGGDLMDQMVGNETLHEEIAAATPGMEAMHLTMGRMATGCY